LSAVQRRSASRAGRAGLRWSWSRFGRPGLGFDRRLCSFEKRGLLTCTATRPSGRQCGAHLPRAQVPWSVAQRFVFLAPVRHSAQRVARNDTPLACSAIPTIASDSRGAGACETKAERSLAGPLFSAALWDKKLVTLKVFPQPRFLPISVLRTMALPDRFQAGSTNHPVKFISIAGFECTHYRSMTVNVGHQKITNYADICHITGTTRLLQNYPALSAQPTGHLRRRLLMILPGRRSAP
jgi:hypothetical protein